ncbi:MAG: FMN-binding glutamate synthase family protein, partial [Myxococcales bacterium]|nr:FMN-binding glutamate synthase family protein [Myxococcales bacterium]
LALASFWWTAAAWPLAMVLVLLAVAIHDITQTRHSILRTHPVLGHLRYLLESVGPELRQYMVEDNTEGRPFNRDQRSLMYQRAKDAIDKKPFGTERDVYAEGHGWFVHSMAPAEPVDDPARALRVSFGSGAGVCRYSASIFNISAMSFGSLSGRAVAALNHGAREGGFFHNTGEGGVSRHHRDPGGDLVWQLGTAYFGCRRSDGRFDPGAFRETAAQDNVKMIELKLSQGAKPGHGGILPAEKITPEIAEARGVTISGDCISPPHHPEFSTPIGLLEFVARLRELSGGKPVGIKFSVGDPLDVLALCHAIVETDQYPDFIAVDGGEGGTGAAPIEFSDAMGMPVKEAIVLVRNALTGIAARDRVRIIASAKLVTSFDMAAALALGADTVSSARGFMFALGCIQAQQCHRNTCPVGVTSQNPSLERALVVEGRARRVQNFHRNTVGALADVLGAAGLRHPSELERRHLYLRVSPWEIRPMDELYPDARTGELLDSSGDALLHQLWRASGAQKFGAST